MIRLFFIACVSFMLISCSEIKQGVFNEMGIKVYTPDIEIRYEGGEACAIHEEERYSGKVYSLDESCYMIFKNGVATEAYAYIHNNALLFEANFPLDKINIWIYDGKGTIIAKAVKKDGNWNFYDSLKPDTVNNTIPWMSPNDCKERLSKYYISLSDIESCFRKLPDVNITCIEP
ncbi:MAG: hypothetical protein IKA00_07575 [Prevotella sp.]|nr:hypothetical protein [Prevotella sp.]